ncbi:MAG: hypothetical protein ACMUHM_01105 [Thermoplasmatota archaeon]
MTRTVPLLAGALSVASLLLMILISNPVNADPQEYRALIIISDYEGTDDHELEKGVAFYDYLIENGYHDDDIIFLTSENVSCMDDNVTIENINEAFQWLIDEGKQKTTVNVYISDNTHHIASRSYYQFSNGTVNCSDIIRWIDQISYDTLNYITLGNHSGWFGPQLVGENRVVISSMREFEESFVDRFNITRSLEDPTADTDCDGKVSFVEAFYNEEQLLIRYDQHPVLWCP